MYKMILFDKAVAERFLNIFSKKQIAEGLGISVGLLTYKLRKNSPFNADIQSNWIGFLKQESEKLTYNLQTINKELTEIENYLTKK